MTDYLHQANMPSLGDHLLAPCHLNLIDENPSAAWPLHNWSLVSSSLSHPSQIARSCYGPSARLAYSLAAAGPNCAPQHSCTMHKLHASSCIQCAVQLSPLKAGQHALLLHGSAMRWTHPTSQNTPTDTNQTAMQPPLKQCTNPTTNAIHRCWL